MQGEALIGAVPDRALRRFAAGAAFLGRTPGPV